MISRTLVAMLEVAGAACIVASGYMTDPRIGLVLLGACAIRAAFIFEGRKR